MSGTLRVPQVTQQDLLDFHVTAFGRPFPSPLDPGFALSSDDPALDKDPDLGHYPDGVQRTLTDEQIAIFRHSEIRKLLRERARIAGETSAAELSEGEIESDGVGPDVLERYEPVNDALEATHPSGLDEDEQDDEGEYAEFLARERREFVEATQRQRQRHARRHDDQDRTISTRRKIREMDEQHDSIQTISYDEQDSAPNTSTGHGGSEKAGLIKEAEVQGKKIWWPEIGVDSEANLYVSV